MNDTKNTKQYKQREDKKKTTKHNNKQKHIRKTMKTAKHVRTCEAGSLGLCDNIIKFHILCKLILIFN